jgi:hypothetical protein
MRHKAGPQSEVKWSKIKGKYGQITLNQLSNPHGNVQRCPSNPQEKRRTGTGEEILTPNSNKGK